MTLIQLLKEKSNYYLQSFIKGYNNDIFLGSYSNNTLLDSRKSNYFLKFRNAFKRRKKNIINLKSKYITFLSYSRTSNTLTLSLCKQFSIFYSRLSNLRLFLERYINNFFFRFSKSLKKFNFFFRKSNICYNKLRRLKHQKIYYYAIEDFHKFNYSNRYKFVDNLKFFGVDDLMDNDLNMIQFFSKRYGVSTYTSTYICSYLGISANYKVSNLAIYMYYLTVSFFFETNSNNLDDKLYNNILSRHIFKINLENRTSKRLLDGYPIYGQRTRSNSKTAAKFPYKLKFNHTL